MLYKVYMSLIHESLLNCPREPVYPKCEDCSVSTKNRACPFYNGGISARKKSAQQFAGKETFWNPGVVLGSSTTLFKLTEDVNLDELKGTTKY